MPLEWIDWMRLFSHYLMLSLLSFGGITTATPELQHFLVEEQHWITSAQFSSFFAIARAAPGPNVLFIGLTGWGGGLNSGGIAIAMIGVGVSLVGILLPSTTVTYIAAQWANRNKGLLSVRAFKQGMAPIVIALMIATGCVLATGGSLNVTDWPVWLLAVASAIVAVRSDVHLLWLLAVGALMGVLGWV